MPNIQPNRYTLQSLDGQTKVDYETSNFAGQQVLNLTQGIGPTRHFAGSQVRVLSTEIGSLVSVTTRMTIDAGSTSFSVLIPAITLKSATDQEAFTTDAIVTNHSGPINVPFLNGVHETYQFIPLKGEASLILTLAQHPVPEAAATAKAK